MYSVYVYTERRMERGKQKKNRKHTVANSASPSPKTAVQTNKCTKFVTSSTPTIWINRTKYERAYEIPCVDMKMLDKIAAR